MNLFYATNIRSPHFILNAEESKHIIKVLRMKINDSIFFTDGRGNLYNCTIENDNLKGCKIKVNKIEKGKDKRNFKIHMAVAPTKNINRYEWFLEKVTEFGVDNITPIICNHSERKILKIDRLKKVIVAALKQSLKTFLPALNEPVSFNNFIKQTFNGQKFIAYIHPEINQELINTAIPNKNTLILIGPEGGFSPDEVKKAIDYGFKPVKLGPSRLRTETAAIAACHTIHDINLLNNN